LTEFTDLVPRLRGLVRSFEGTLLLVSLDAAPAPSVPSCPVHANRVMRTRI